jgi:hypothetical protein
MKKIFISSTSSDLHEARSKVIKTINKLDEYLPIAMEYFTSSNETPQNFCENKILECDLFVSIIGHKYGSLLNKNISYTEHEYNTADHLNKQKLIFIKSIDSKIYAHEIESDEKRKRLESFKSKLEERHVINYFTSDDELAIILLEALHNLRISAKFNYESIEEKPYYQFIGRTPPHPYFHKPYSMQKNFVGRDREKEIILKWSKEDQSVLFIEGIGGIGKSSLTWHILKKLRADNSFNGYFWWSFYDGNVDFKLFIQTLTWYCSNGKIKLHKNTDIIDTAHILIEYIENNRFLIILDGLERLLKPYDSDNTIPDHAININEFHSKAIGIALQTFITHEIRSKIIINSRSTPEIFKDNINTTLLLLKDIHKDDAKNLLSKEGVVTSTSDLYEIQLKIGYHPLSIKLLSGFLKNSLENNVSIEYILDNIIDIDSLIGVSYFSCTKKSRDFLSNIAAFREMPTVHEIKDILQLNDQDVLKLSHELINRNLIYFNDTINSYDMHPIVKMYAYKQLKNKPELHKIIHEYYSNLPAINNIEISSISQLKPIIEYIYHGTKSERYDDTYQVYVNEIRPYIFRELADINLAFSIVNSYFTKGFEHLPSLSNPIDQANCVIDLATLLRMKGKPYLSQIILDKALGKLNDNHRIKNIAIGVENLANEAIKNLKNKRGVDLFKSKVIILNYRISPKQRGELDLLYRHSHAISSILYEMAITKVIKGDFINAEVILNNSILYNDNPFNQSLYALILTINNFPNKAGDIFYQLINYSEQFRTHERSQIYENFSTALLFHNELEYALESAYFANNYAREDKLLIRMITSELLISFISSLLFYKTKKNKHIISSKKHLSQYESIARDTPIDGLSTLHFLTKGLLYYSNGDIENANKMINDSYLLANQQQMAIYTNAIKHALSMENNGASIELLLSDISQL